MTPLHLMRTSVVLQKAPTQHSGECMPPPLWEEASKAMLATCVGQASASPQPLLGWLVALIHHSHK